MLKYEQMMDADEWFWLKADSLLLHFSTYIFPRRRRRRLTRAPQLDSIWLL